VFGIQWFGPGLLKVKSLPPRSPRFAKNAKKSLQKLGELGFLGIRGGEFARL
jgi:hypothetical protein